MRVLLLAIVIWVVPTWAQIPCIDYPCVETLNFTTRAYPGQGLELDTRDGEFGYHFEHTKIWGVRELPTYTAKILSIKGNNYCKFNPTSHNILVGLPIPKDPTVEGVGLFSVHTTSYIESYWDVVTELPSGGGALLSYQHGIGINGYTIDFPIYRDQFDLRSSLTNTLTFKHAGFNITNPNRIVQCEFQGEIEFVYIKNSAISDTISRLPVRSRAN